MFNLTRGCHHQCLSHYVATAWGTTRHHHTSRARGSGSGGLLLLLDNGLLLDELAIRPSYELDRLLSHLLRSLLLDGNLLDTQLLALQQHLLIGIVGIEGLLLGRLLLLLRRSHRHSRLLLNGTQSGSTAGTHNHLSLSLLLQPEHLLLLREARWHLALDYDVAGRHWSGGTSSNHATRSTGSRLVGHLLAQHHPRLVLLVELGDVLGPLVGIQGHEVGVRLLVQDDLLLLRLLQHYLLLWRHLTRRLLLLLLGRWEHNLLLLLDCLGLLLLLARP